MSTKRGGAQPGNQNAARKPWKEALTRALARSGGSVEKGLNKVADQVVIAANEGDQWAIGEIGNRIDGRAPQQQILTGPDDEAITLNITIKHD